MIQICPYREERICSQLIHKICSMDTITWRIVPGVWVMQPTVILNSLRIKLHNQDLHASVLRTFFAMAAY